MTSDRFIVGIDGGGSGCRVAIASMDGAVLGQTSGGPANYTTDSVGALRNLRATIAQVTTALDGQTVDLSQAVAHIGLAGVMNASDQSDVANALPFARASVSDDRVTTVAGALGAADGIVLSAGTGSFAASQRHGDLRLLGGWGHVLGDQASGVWLGLQALRRVLLAYDGLQPRSKLAKNLMDALGGSPIALVDFGKTAEPSTFAALAPEVIAAASAGDSLAKALMQEGADYLQACLEELGFDGKEALCLTGGIGPHYGPYLRQKAQNCVIPSAGTALDGALHLARKLAGGA